MKAPVSSQSTLKLALDINLWQRYVEEVGVSQSQSCIDTESNSSLFCIYRNAVDGNKKLYAIYDTR